jgi:hypothetical protein
MYVKIQIFDSANNVLKESLTKYDGSIIYDEKIFEMVEEAEGIIAGRRSEWLTQNGFRECDVAMDEMGHEYVTVEGYDDYVDGETVSHSPFALYIPIELQSGE